MLPLLEAHAPPGWTLLPGVRLPRLQRRIEAVLIAPGAVLAFARDRATAAAAGIDLADFHAGCQGVPVLPVALLERERVMAQTVLPLAGAAPVVACTRLLLPGLLAQVARFPPVPSLDPAAWASAAYRPVPSLLNAACALYAQHGEARLLLASSGRGELARTRAAVEAAVAAAQAGGNRQVVFVTGHPGAGKTLCGLDLAFAPTAAAAFLTGNPALVHVLRGALVRDAASRGLSTRAAQQRVAAVVQPLHAFRDHYVPSTQAPPERLVVLDEAQRCWTGTFARSKTRNRAVPLSDSEPGHLLDVLARHAGWCVLVCLLGGGQEIHAGEGGLAAWGEALATRPEWRAVAAPSALTATDPRQRLPPSRRLTLDPALHLGEPIRSWRAPRMVAWVDAVLQNDPAQARRIAGDDLPVRLTRTLPAMRASLLGNRGRAGLVATAGARRLRAEGLGGLLWHQDEDAVARWYLDEWPDIRGSDALEIAATEFGAQGLELDRVGVCWDQDLARTPDGSAWQPRTFRGTAWTLPRGADAVSNRLNAYRVLLTRARDLTVIWVPRGEARDATRSPARYEAIAAFLRQCGVRWLEEDDAHEH